VLNLADYGRIRVMADRLGIETIDREGRIVVLKFRPQAKIDPVRLVALVRQRPELTLVPPAALKLSLDIANGSGLMAEKPRSGSHQPSAISHVEGREGKPAAPPPATSHGKGRQRQPAAAPSWWVARAREGEVKPGFTKADILRPAKEDPRAPGGVFERVGGLLSDLLDQG
jgi:hypothetical protein